MTERAAEHQGVLDRLSDKFDELESLQERIRNAEGELGKSFEPIIKRLDNPEKFRERIQELADSEDDNKLKFLRIIDGASGDLDADDIRDQISDIREEIRSQVGNVSAGQEVAKRMIQSAQGMLERAKAEASTAIVIVRAIEVATEHIANAKAAFDSGDYGRAFGQANSAISVLKKAFNDDGDDELDKIRNEIKTRIGEGSNELKVEIKERVRDGESELKTRFESANERFREEVRTRTKFGSDDSENEDEDDDDGNDEDDDSTEEDDD